MTDLETLRAALKDPVTEPFHALDLDRIMADGRRLRRRRRLVVAAAGTGVAAAVLVATAAVAGHLSPGPDRPDRHRVAAEPATATMGPGTPPPAPTAPPQPSPPLPAVPQRGAPPVPAPSGQVIRTGTGDRVGERVFYVFQIEQARLPDVHFGVMAARLLPDGTIVADLAVNEDVGSDRSPGFHAVHDGSDGTPAFGYYSGPVARITGTVDGRPTAARQAAWSEDPGIVVFWFEPTGRTVADLSALDARGAALPAGNPRG
jgi:hypothetical protein